MKPLKDAAEQPAGAGSARADKVVDALCEMAVAGLNPKTLIEAGATLENVVGSAPASLTAALSAQQIAQ
jgi:hypothetical protein